MYIYIYLYLYFIFIMHNIKIEFFHDFEQSNNFTILKKLQYYLVDVIGILTF